MWEWEKEDTVGPYSLGSIEIITYSMTSLPHIDYQVPKRARMLIRDLNAILDEKEKTSSITTQTFSFHQMPPSLHPIPRLGAYTAARNSSSATEIGVKRAASRIGP